jgi:hypothetical protein
LRKLWIDFPEKREAMADAMGRYGTTRRYVAQTREALFAAQDRAFAINNSRLLADSWYIDTNLNQERKRCLMRVATQACGLVWGKDIQVYWSAKRLP